MTIPASFIAIGDSFTEGVGDPYPGDHGDGEEQLRGWADRLAERISAARVSQGQAPLLYANLAIRGKRLDDVVGPQLEAALSQNPEMISIVGGGNDMLRTSVDLDQLAAELGQAIVTIRERGIRVMLATPVDPAGGGIFGALRGRHGIHTANLLSLAAQHGCEVVNQWRLPQMITPGMWAPDRIHLSCAGHERVALAAAHVMGIAENPLLPDGSDWIEPFEVLKRDRREVVKTRTEWARVHAAPWLHRRLTGRSSGDGLSAKRPVLTPVP